MKFNSITRIEVDGYVRYDPYFEAVVKTMPSVLMESDQEEAMLRLLLDEVSEHGSLLFAHPADVTA